MVYQQFVEIGRVVYVARGKDEGKVAAIVDVVDPTRVLIDGPCSGVVRGAVNLKNLQLTKFVLSGIRNGARSVKVKKAWEEAGISKSWAESNWAKSIKAKSLRAAMSDFDRFKLMKAKQMRNRIVRSEMKKLKKKAKK